MRQTPTPSNPINTQSRLEMLPEPSKWGHTPPGALWLVLCGVGAVAQALQGPPRGPLLVRGDPSHDRVQHPEI